MNKRKVLLITRYFPPLNCTATVRMYTWAKYFTKWGWEVEVLTTSKHNQISIPLPLDTSFVKLHEVPYFDPIALFPWEKQVKSQKFEKKGLWGVCKQALLRLYRERLNERMPGRTDLWFFPALRALKKLKSQGCHFDCVISSYGPPMCHLVGYHAAKLFQATWVADYRDLWIENHIYKGLWPFTLLESWLEKRYVKHANHLTTVSYALADKLKEKFPCSDVQVVENGFDKGIMEHASNEYFKKEKNIFRLVYTGSIYRNKRDPSPLFKALKELEAEQKLQPGSFEVRFYGASMGDLESLIEKYQVQAYAKYWGQVNQLEAFDIQESSDALLLLEDPHPPIDGNLTGKLFEYLYASPPLIAVGIHRDMEAGRLIRRVNGGFICGQDVKAIKTCLLDLMNTPPAFAKRKDLIASYSRENQALKVMEIVSGACVEAGS